MFSNWYIFKNSLFTIFPLKRSTIALNVCLVKFEMKFSFKKVQIWSIWSTFDFLLKIFIKRRNFTHFIHYISRSKFETKKCLIAIKSYHIYNIWLDLNANWTKTLFLNRPVGGISISCERQQYYLLFISYLKPNSY